jgi:dTDP-glucose 4,6-dehydratase
VNRILLTGAGGFVGSHMLRHLLANTDDIITCPVTFRYRGKSQRIASALEDHPEWKNRVKIVMHDLTAPIDSLTAHKFGKITHILNIASESHVDRSIETPVPFVQNNVNLMLHLLEYARTLDSLRMFLQMSTDEVYGPMINNIPSKEWDTILPSNPYSASKAAQEAICISYWRTYGVPLMITNTMNLFGEMQDTEKYFAKVMRAIRFDEVVTVHADGMTGEIGSRFYIHARNFADAWLTLINDNCAAIYDGIGITQPERVNIVGEREVNNLELAQMIAAHMGKKLKYEFVDFHSNRPGHDLKYGLDGTLMRESFEWKPPYTFEETVHNTVQWTLAHPEWL